MDPFSKQRGEYNNNMKTQTGGSVEFEAELVTIPRFMLREVAEAAHTNGQLFTKGHLHRGPFDQCEAMMCEDVRSYLTQTGRTDEG